MEREKILDDILRNSGVTPQEETDLKALVKNSSIYNSKSDMLFRFGLMNQLMFDAFGPYLDMFLVLADPNTSEVVSFTHASKLDGQEDSWEKSEKTIDYLISDLCVASAIDSRTTDDGKKAGNVTLTVLMNVVARFCANSDDYKKGFEQCLEHWNKIKEKRDKEKEENRS